MKLLASPKARVFWPLLLGVLVTDYVTKQIAEAALAPPGTPHDVIGGVVRLTLGYNRGAAMSLPLGFDAKVPLGVLALVVSVVLFGMYRKADAEDRLSAAAFGLIVAGALGNAVERLGSPRGVVDFIDMGLAGLRFWTFNVADIGVTVGAALLALVVFRDDRRERSAADPEPPDPEPPETEAPETEGQET